MKKINVSGSEIMLYNVDRENYISITDIAKYKNPDSPADIIKNWMRSKNTIELLGLWERIHNQNFKLVEFDQFRNQAGYNHFVLSPKKWIDSTNAIGLQSKPGRYGGTFAHADIALEFASWVSVEFKFYLLKEFQRLKENQTQELDWSVKRSLTKINYRIHTDAIKEHLIPQQIDKKQASFLYASEADVLNVALFGMTSAQWQKANPDEKGDIRDNANVIQLVCLANLENLNALFISERLPQNERLERLNEIAIKQMKLLVEEANRKLLR
ncbi:KilA-N domain protein [Sedimentisphaera cyanobacteriorum]|uniref:KilA-N domain protein n=1 Tax=Sedimentisphaera cyanobacteriorum TaxID=1940790 RepID=A0A1Q2HSU1_9BACT|nr:KilA-N domain-containing protein [Sedimentisphaera cyanobacteriorum]AQQ10401.1 KilA-N domain protein [Sedimentisphaera cyanobacteriorum]